MPVYNNTITETLSAGGGTISLPTSESNVTMYILDGTDTLAASYTVIHSGNVYEGLEYRIKYIANMTLNGNNITIFTKALTQEQASSYLDINAVYVNSAWQTTIEMTDDQDDSYKGAESTVVATSGTITLYPKINKKYQKYTGTVTLVGNYTIAVDVATSTAGDEFFIDWQCACTTGANTLSILGVTIPSDLALTGNFTVQGYYDGSAWQGKLMIPDVYADQVANADMANMAALTVKANATNASANPQDVAAGSANQVFKRNGSNALVFDSVRRADYETASSTADGLALTNIQYIADQRMVGNITGGNASPAALTADEVKTFLGIEPSELLEADTTIATASVLTLNSVPVAVIAAPGANKAIEVISATAYIDYAGVAYATNTGLQLTFNPGVGDAVTSNTTVLAANADKMFKLAFVTNTGTTVQMLTNTALYAYTPTGDPTAGTSPLRIQILYRILDFS